MTTIALARFCAFWAIMHAQAPEEPDAPTWRLISTPSIHIGIRPASHWGEGAGITIQISTHWH